MELAVLTKKLSEGVQELNALLEVTREQLKAAREAQREAQEKIAGVEFREKKVAEQEHRLETSEQIEKKTSDLITAQSEFSKEQKAFAAKCSEVRAGFEQREADLLSAQKDIALREEALEKEKNEYKDRIRAELNRINETI